MKEKKRKMAITTKRLLNNSKYKQDASDVLNLSGETRIFGGFSLRNGNQGNTKVLISDSDGNFDWEERGIANGLATLDSNQMLNQNIHANKITEGTIDLSRLPQGALERLIHVADETERFNLTTDDVQKGDTVQQDDNNNMYIVVDESNLDNSSGYEAYNAARASAVDWSGVENKPSDITDLSTHDATELSDINDSGSGEIITDDERTKLDGIESGAEANVQSDWNETDTSVDSFIQNKPDLASVATSNDYFDLDNIPKYQTIVVSNEAEFIDATETLQGSAGTILFSDHITLTQDHTLNLENIKIDGNKRQLKFDGYTITSDTPKVYFYNVQLYGTTEGETNDNDKILIFTEKVSAVFNYAEFRYLSNFDSVSDITTSTPNIEFYNSVNLFIFNSTVATPASEGTYPILFEIGSNTTPDYIHISLSDNYNRRRNCYFGFWGTLAEGGDEYFNDITHDQSLPILNGSDYLDIPSEVIYGRSDFHMVSSSTQSLLEEDSNWDENNVYKGSTITDAVIGLKHYDSDYYYEFVDDETPIRLNRKADASSLEDIESNTVLGNSGSTQSEPHEVHINENEFLGRLSGENIKGVESVDIYGVSSDTQSLLEDDSNWDEDNVYTGSTINDADKGLRHYDSTYVYEFVEADTPVRYLRNISDNDLGTMSEKDFWMGTQTEYDDLSSYDSNTIYFITS